MKIKEIVAESDVGDIANLSAKNVGSGYDTVSKLFSPSQWFKGNDVKIDDEPTDQKSKTATSQKSKTVKDKKTTLSPTLHLEKESLLAASQGKPIYKGDIDHIKSVYGKVKSGKIAVDDVDSTLLGLKAAINGQQLSDQQKAVLAQLSKQI